MGKASGSMTRATAKVPPTGIKGQLKSTIGERLRMRPNRENLSVAERIRVDRIHHEAAGIVPTNQASPIAVGATALLEEVSEAAKRGNRATVVVQAVKAHPHEVEVEVAEAAVAEAVEVVAAGAGN